MKIYTMVFMGLLLSSSVLLSGQIPCTRFGETMSDDLACNANKRVNAEQKEDVGATYILYDGKLWSTARASVLGEDTEYPQFECVGEQHPLVYQNYTKQYVQEFRHELFRTWIDRTQGPATVVWSFEQETPEGYPDYVTLVGQQVDNLFALRYERVGVGDLHTIDGHTVQSLEQSPLFVFWKERDVRLNEAPPGSQMRNKQRNKKIKTYKT